MYNSIPPLYVAIDAGSAILSSSNSEIEIQFHLIEILSLTHSFHVLPSSSEDKLIEQHSSNFLSLYSKLLWKSILRIKNPSLSSFVMAY